jgi:hypothetical protein
MTATQARTRYVRHNATATTVHANRQRSTHAPQAQQWSLQSQFGGASVASSAPATSQQAMVLPSMPALGPKYAEPDQAPLPDGTAAARHSGVPTYGTSIMGTLAGDQRCVIIRLLW